MAFCKAGFFWDFWQKQDRGLGTLGQPTWLLVKEKSSFNTAQRQAGVKALSNSPLTQADQTSSPLLKAQHYQVNKPAHLLVELEGGRGISLSSSIITAIRWGWAWRHKGDSPPQQVRA